VVGTQRKIDHAFVSSKVGKLCNYVPNAHHFGKAVQMIFRRSLLRELTMNATYVFVVLVAILVTQFLVRLIGAASSGSLPTEGLLPLVGFRLLSQLPPLIVIAVFISTLLTVSRGWRDSETPIWMSAGQSLVAWIRPVLTFAIPLLLVSATLSLFLSPWAEKRTVEYRRILEARDELSVLAPGLFQERRRDKQVFFVESTDLLRGSIRNVFVFADDPNGAWVTRAKEGSIFQDERGDRYVILEQGKRIRRAGANAAPTEYEFASFDRYGVRMNAAEVRDDPFEERATDTKALLEKGTPSAYGWVFFRVSIPLAGLSLALLAIPLAYVNPRLGRSINLIIAILLLMITLNLINIVQAQIGRQAIGLIAALLIFHLTLALGVAAYYFRRYRGAVYVWPWQRNRHTPASRQT
jgi:lipopolysaccharide export system permease protein